MACRGFRSFRNFFKQKTAYVIPKRDWSSDVCSSDLPGFELRFGQTEHSFLVGFNRFAESEPMYGWLEVSGKPVIAG